MRTHAVLTANRSALARLGAALLIAAGVLAMPLARAHDATDEITVTVSYADLDLDTASGVATLYGRLQRAARAVCSRYDGDPLLLHAFRLCTRNALGDAVQKVGRPALTAYHERTRGNLLPTIAALR